MFSIDGTKECPVFKRCQLTLAAVKLVGFTVFVDYTQYSFPSLALMFI